MSDYRIQGMCQTLEVAYIALVSYNHVLVTIARVSLRVIGSLNPFRTLLVLSNYAYRLQSSGKKNNRFTLGSKPL